jgi:(p)ppGpp synthase/HD superfamily hydrolase
MTTTHLLDPDLLQTAARFAAEAHGGQLVPGSQLPYFLHLHSVMAEVAVSLSVEPAVQDDAEVALLCALLHDVLEVTTVTAEALGARFGPQVTAGVQALTKDASLPKAERMADSLRRIRRQPPVVWRVKLADRIVNLQRPPAHWTHAKMAAYQVEAQEILAALGGASAWLAARLAGKIAAYDEWVGRE